MSLPPVRRSVEVGVPIERAYAAATTELAAWWPLATHGCTGEADAALAFDGDELVETGSDGVRHVWGTALRWEPPYGLLMTWHPGGDPGEATEVEFVLTALSATRTRIEVVHRGWERRPEPARARSEYDGGWPRVLGALGALLEDDARPEEWFILAHSPGPAWVEGQPPQAQPGMGEHFAFIARLAAKGHLVAAGPLPGTPGSGQTMVRGLSRERATELATTDDPAVVSGLFAVDVIPWLVVDQG